MTNGSYLDQFHFLSIANSHLVTILSKMCPNEAMVAILAFLRPNLSILVLFKLNCLQSKVWLDTKFGLLWPFFANCCPPFYTILLYTQESLNRNGKIHIHKLQRLWMEQMKNSALYVKYILIKRYAF